MLQTLDKNETAMSNSIVFAPPDFISLQWEIDRLFDSFEYERKCSADKLYLCPQAWRCFDDPIHAWGKIYSVQVHPSPFSCLAVASKEWILTANKTWFPHATNSQIYPHRPLPRRYT